MVSQRASSQSSKRFTCRGPHWQQKRELWPTPFLGPFPLRAPLENLRRWLACVARFLRGAQRELWVKRRPYPPRRHPYANPKLVPQGTYSRRLGVHPQSWHHPSPANGAGRGWALGAPPALGAAPRAREPTPKPASPTAASAAPKNGPPALGRGLLASSWTSAPTHSLR